VPTSGQEAVKAFKYLAASCFRDTLAKLTENRFFTLHRSHPGRDDRFAHSSYTRAKHWDKPAAVAATSRNELRREANNRPSLISPNISAEHSPTTQPPSTIRHPQTDITEPPRCLSQSAIRRWTPSPLRKYLVPRNTLFLSLIHHHSCTTAHHGRPELYSPGHQHPPKYTRKCCAHIVARPEARRRHHRRR
jgi:hypothetical protein